MDLCADRVGASGLWVSQGDVSVSGEYSGHSFDSSIVEAWIRRR